jgi:hypothetical protein
MDLYHRLADIADLRMCEALLDRWSDYSADQIYVLRLLWSSIVENKEQTGMPLIVEDRHRPVGQRILAFSFTGFMYDEFVADYKHATDDLRLTYRLAATIRKGSWPLLGPTAVAKLNASSGLNLLIISQAQDKALSNEEVGPYIRDRLVAAILKAHAGFNLKEVLAECSERDLAWAIRCGLRLRGRSRVGCNSELSLVGMTREEAKCDQGTLASLLFSYTAPRFHFNLREQQLLRAALEGKTDDEICNALSLSLSTVKKRWSLIYDEVIEADASLIPNGQQAVHGNTRGVSTRGAEKRRRLIEYLRRHPEELVPHLPLENSSSRKGRSKK